MPAINAPKKDGAMRGASWGAFLLGALSISSMLFLQPGVAGSDQKPSISTKKLS
jgi:hypothetical protein